MVIADPASDLVSLVVGAGDPPPDRAPEAARRQAALIRRRFGLALPVPLAEIPEGLLESASVRVAEPTDAAAIAAVKWRAFGVNYRGGILADRFLDQRDIVPPLSYWVGRAMVPPSRRHRLLVWAGRGVVLGYLEAGPADLSDAEGGGAGEIHELYVDPAAQGRGGGGALLDAAESFFVEVGWGRAELSVLSGNREGQRFYRRRGWIDTGRTVEVDLGSVAFTELRFARRLGPDRP